MLPFKDVKDAFILGSVEEVTATLEDSLGTMATILASRCLPWHLAFQLQQHAAAGPVVLKCYLQEYCYAALLGAVVWAAVLLRFRKA